jgi:hypothetical protein
MMNRKDQFMPVCLFRLSAFMAAVFLLCACEKEELTALQKLPELEDGSFVIEVYDAQENLVFSREGEAYHFAPRDAGEEGHHFSLHDPFFLDEGVEEKFGYFVLSKAEAIKNTGVYELEKDALSAAFYERFLRYQATGLMRQQEAS